MKKLSRIFFLVLGSALGSMLVYRFMSRQKNLPCPASLAWLLDNPLTRRIAGAQLLLDRAGVAPGMRVLDVGCGSGRIAVPAAQRVGEAGEVVCFDLQSAMLRLAQRRAASAGAGNIRFVQGNAGEGSIPDGDFDRAFLVTVLGEIPDRLGALREVFRILKPGGVLSVTEIGIGDPHYQSPGVVASLAREAGFVEGESFVKRPAYTINLIKPGKTS